jgi:hypothetical protein
LGILGTTRLLVLNAFFYFLFLKKILVLNARLCFRLPEFSKSIYSFPLKLIVPYIYIYILKISLPFFYVLYLNLIKLKRIILEKIIMFYFVEISLINLY